MNKLFLRDDYQRQHVPRITMVPRCFVDKRGSPWNKMPGNTKLGAWFNKSHYVIL